MAIPKATIERIIKEAGVERVSAESLTVMIDVAEKFIKEVALKSYGYTQHAGRSTLKGDDIRMALQITS